MPNFYISFINLGLISLFMKNSPSNITKNKEDYLNEIYRLQSSNNRAIKGSELANALKVTKPSVSEMLKKLSKEKLIIFSGKKGVTLTKDGVKKAQNTIRKHQLLEVFFKDLLNLKKHFHNEAHKVEHEISDEATDKLDDFLKNPKICPDGNPIPEKNSKILELSQISENINVKILFSKSNDKKILERLTSLGITPKTKILIKRKITNGPMILDVKGAEIALGNDITSKIFVELE